MAKLAGVRFLEATADDEAPLWLWGIPYDGTMSHRPGARFGPDEIRASSQGIESWSPYQRRDLLDLSVHDAGNLELSFSSPERALKEVRGFAASLFEGGKKSCALGGEHSATAPIVGAAAGGFYDLHVVHIDAHCDMRPSYGGTPLSHASVTRRILEHVPPDRYHALGMRSGDREEFGFAERLPHFHPYTLEDAPRVAASVPEGTPVYITLDLDVLDPAFFPGTGAPEPMGVSVRELHEALLAFKPCRIVGVDAMELSPHYDPSHASAAVAAFFVRELLLLMG